MEIIAFTLVGIMLYLFSDWALNKLEQAHGEPLPQRNLIFLVLILTLSLSSFSIIRTLLEPAEGSQDDYQEQQATDG